MLNEGHFKVIYINQPSSFWNFKGFWDSGAGLNLLLVDTQYNVLSYILSF